MIHYIVNASCVAVGIIAARVVDYLVRDFGGVMREISAYREKRRIAKARKLLGVP